MSFEYRCRKERLYDGGNEVLSYKLETPYAEGYGEINSFYESIVNECEKYCKEALFEELCELCRKNGRERYSYRLIAKVTHFDGELMSVVFLARLRERRKTVSQYVGTHTWELQSECMLPPKILYKKIGEKKSYKSFRKGDAQGVFLNNGRVSDVGSVDIDRILSE